MYIAYERWQKFRDKVQVNVGMRLMLYVPRPEAWVAHAAIIAHSVCLVNGYVLVTDD